jgi:hypothetical protein
MNLMTEDLYPDWDVWCIFLHHGVEMGFAADQASCSVSTGEQCGKN